MARSGPRVLKLILYRRYNKIVSGELETGHRTVFLSARSWTNMAVILIEIGISIMIEISQIISGNDRQKGKISTTWRSICLIEKMHHFEKWSKILKITDHFEKWLKILNISRKDWFILVSFTVSLSKKWNVVEQWSLLSKLQLITE